LLRGAKWHPVEAVLDMLQVPFSLFCGLFRPCACAGLFYSCAAIAHGQAAGKNRAFKFLSAQADSANSAVR